MLFPCPADKTCGYLNLALDEDTGRWQRRKIQGLFYPQHGHVALDSFRQLCLANKQTHHEAHEALFESTTITFTLDHYFLDVFMPPHDEHGQRIGERWHTQLCMTSTNLDSFPKTLRRFKMLRPVCLPNWLNVKAHTWWVTASIEIKREAPGFNITWEVYYEEKGEPMQCSTEPRCLCWLFEMTTGMLEEDCFRRFNAIGLHLDDVLELVTAFGWESEVMCKAKQSVRARIKLEKGLDA